VIRKFSIAALAVLAIAGAAYLHARTHRPATVRSYYRLLRKWGDRPGYESRAAMLAKCEPFLLKIGVLGPARVQIESKISFFLDPRDLVPATILKTGEWQPEIWDSLSPSLPENAVFYDVGAHIGYFSMKAAARVGTAGRVVAFEPNPETLKLLSDNVSANGFANITVEPIACTDREQTLTLFAAPRANTGASSLSRDNAAIVENEAPKPYPVRGRPIDDITDELKLGRVDAIKIDVEGAEGLVLRGAIKTLNRFHPKVVLEVVPRQLASFQTTPEDIAKLLESAGYTFHRALGTEQTDFEWTTQPLTNIVQMNDPAVERQLVSGFYSVEGGAWRWTAKAFSIALRPINGASSDRGASSDLVLNFTIPDVAYEALKGVTISSRIAGVSLGSESFSTAGAHVYRRPVAASLLRKDPVQVDFSLDKSITAAGRELGLVVTSAGFESHR
jgi:FkbM family methyltransferase